ncbi:MAG: hypothetical protein ACK5P7_05915 [Bdellovibrio sp.]
MRLKFRALVLAFAWLIAGPCFAQTAARQPARGSVSARLFDGTDVLKMTEQEQDEYLDAIREFMDKRQYRAPSFSQYFLDIIMGTSSAEAQVMANDCVVGGNVKNTPECRTSFISRVRSGGLGECREGAVSSSGNFVNLICGGNTYQYPSQDRSSVVAFLTRSPYNSGAAQREVRAAVVGANSNEPGFDPGNCEQQIQRYSSTPFGPSNDQLSRSPRCYNIFIERIRSGALGHCTDAAQDWQVTRFSCARKNAQGQDVVSVYQIHHNTPAGKTQLDGAIREGRVEAARIEAGRAAAANDILPPSIPGAPPAAGQPATATAPPGGQPAASAVTPGGRPATQAQDAARATARCFFSGFAIARIENQPCVGITDLCAQNNRMQGLSQVSLNALIPCRTAEEKKKATCGDSSAAQAAPTSPAPPIQPQAAVPSASTTVASAGSTIRSNSQQGRQVVCNPILYGTKPDGSVLCVPRSSTASAACGGIANDQKLKELLKKAPHGEKAFGEMVDTINKECQPFWTVGATGGPTEKADAIARTGDTNATDFKDTCKILLERALEIGERIASDNNAIKEKVKVIRQAVGTGAPAGPPPPARPATPGVS